MKNAEIEAAVASFDGSTMLGFSVERGEGAALAAKDQAGAVVAEADGGNLDEATRKLAAKLAALTPPTEE
jgi:hypothetical protein